MPDLAVSAYVTRTELSLGNLALDIAGTYKIARFGRGALSWRRETVESPYVHGRTLVGKVKDVVTLTLAIRVYATSAAQLETRIAELVEAFTEQESYSLNVTIDGVEQEFVCEAADLAEGTDGEKDKSALFSKQQLVTFQIPRDPTPVKGAY